MAVELEIRDGSPHWWNSPDIWVVPGNDPGGSPGSPIAGQVAYIWGRVRNNGRDAVKSAQVNFYWSNPATGVLRSNSTYVGSSYVDLDPGESQEVICLSPWTPTIVNDGHECIVAEVIHSAHPLPSPLPDAFDPPDYLQIAQRNLSVLELTSSMMVLAIQVSAPAREKKSLKIFAEFGGELDNQSLTQLGIPKLKFSKKPIARICLSMDRGCENLADEKFCHDLRVDLDPGVSKAVYLKVNSCNQGSGVYTSINVIARDADKIVGGVTFIAIHSKEE